MFFGFAVHVLEVETVSACSYARSNGRLLLRSSHSPVYVVMKDGFVESIILLVVGSQLPLGHVVWPAT